ncbi:MAG TPA: class I SAM-dependent methyltransferase [Tepidisphaeraceae bacterium]|nr:class I SAM-dependent methyltransferase [Tepidisphaeraceae bacterium]
MSTATMTPSIAELNQKLENFKDERFAAAQAANAQRELERFDGQNIESFRRGIDLVRNLPIDDFSLLDIGCGVGLYGVLLRRYSGKRFDYAGCDFSPAMVAQATRLNPGCPISQADARHLYHMSKSFDVVWISALLEHVPEYEQVLAEAARVGRQYMLLHRLFLHGGKTQRQILTTRADEYPFEGFTYPRTIRNINEFDAELEKHGRIISRQAWSFDPARGLNLKLHSYTVRLRQGW